MSLNDKIYRDLQAGSFEQSVPLGGSPGWFSIYAFGTNPDVDTGVGEENLLKWGVYTFQTSASNFYISSTDAGDVGLTYVAILLDEDFRSVTVTGVTNGQNGVQIVGPGGETLFRRGQILFNVTPGGTRSVGNVFIGTEASPVGGEPADANKVLGAYTEDQQSNQAVYTIPRGRVGLLQGFAITTNRNTVGGSSDVYFNTAGNILTDGTISPQAARRRAELGVQIAGNSAFLYNLPYPVALSEGADVFLSAEVTSNNTRLAGGFQVVTREIDGD